MEKNTENRKPYVPPTLTRHGNVVEQTKGNCSCRTEWSGFKPAPVVL